MQDFKRFVTAVIVIVTIMSFSEIAVTYIKNNLLQQKNSACHTDEWYQEAFIEAWESGDSFSFYRGDQEYTFIPKYE